ncbi:MAG: hypothetical protein LBR81_04165 [Prevotellaceae bacterium]|nr:hypothetical protein [Prevotellaceae bacterium]
MTRSTAGNATLACGYEIQPFRLRAWQQLDLEGHIFVTAYKRSVVCGKTAEERKK